MKTLFLTAGNITWASSRMRAYWPAAYMDADVVEISKREQVDASQYDALVFQKSVDLDGAITARKLGKKVFWDLCDPLHWFSPAESYEIVRNVDGVVCSNENLRADFDQWSEGCVPTYVIPDRLELEAFPNRRAHADVDPVRFIWFGLAANRVGLYGAFANLERLAANGYEIELTVYDERPDQVLQDDFFTIYQAKWSLDAENDVISSHDIAILPPYPGSWGCVKSNNRVLTAWACGLPYTDGLNYWDMARMADVPKYRMEKSAEGLGALMRDYDVRQSAREWEAILCK